MNYSDLYTRSSLKPPKALLFAAFISIVALGAVFFQSSQGNAIPTRATQKTVQGLQVIPISAREVGIYWQSDSAEQGWIVVGTSPNSVNTTVLDERDVDTSRASRRNHYIILRNLTEQTTYYYELIAGRELVTLPNGKPYSFTTLAVDNGVRSNLRPAYGKIVNANDSPAADALVFLRITDAYPLVAITKASGEWLIPLQTILSVKSGQGIAVSDADRVSLDFISDNGQSTHVDAPISKITPLPQTIILGKDYQFTSDAVLGASTSLVSAQSSQTSPLQIIYPKQNSVVPAVQPLIKGTGIAGTTVYASINSTPPFSYRTTVGSDGQWLVSVDTPISPGIYTLQVMLPDVTKKTVVLQRTFSIAKSGEQVLGSATASATVTPAQTSIVTPTSIIAAPTSVVLPQQSPTLIRTGNNSLPIAFVSLSFIIIGIGILFIVT